MKSATLSYLVSAASGLLLFGAVPLAFGAPTLPNINTNNIITITDPPYNAMGDGTTDNTIAISSAIVQAAKGGNTNNLFGGIVRIPAPGVFLSGPLTLANNIDLQVDTNATLKMLPVNLFTVYPPQSGNGLTYGDLIYASGVTNLEISGSGTIDGQGLLWWTNNAVVNNRPYMIYFNGCKRVLIQEVTVQNPPKMHIVFKSIDSNITIQGININTTNPLANQCDGIDLVGTNCLVQNCIINAGDDNIALGSSSSTAISKDIVVTNCAFGVGHGVSIGSNTAGAVSNLTVINCTFSGTDYGIRMKSNTNSTGGAGEGGIAQNLSYLNIGMTNIADGAVVIYSYYASGGQFGTPTSVSPFFASTQAVGVATIPPIPVWRNITISNVNATVVGGNGIAGIIWARTEVPATNITFSHVNITAPKAFDIYNAQNVQFLDSRITATSGGQKTFEIWNANIIVSNSVPATNFVSFDGLAGNTNTSLALYNAPASMTSSDLFGANPVTLGGSVLTNIGSLALTGTDVENFALGTNSSRFVVSGALALNSTLNITNASGFAATNYVLFTYTGSLSGTPVLGNTPLVHSYGYSLDTSTAGQVKLVVTAPSPPNFGNIKVAPGSDGGSFVLSGTGGVTNGSYRVLTSTNLALPVSQWKSVATNPFDAGGNFIFTNTPVPSSSQLFYLLQIP